MKKIKNTGKKKLEKNKISKIYLITDAHFSHKNIKEFCNRPDNYEQLIINNWRATVQPEDIIVDLGDTGFCSQQELKNIIENLPGTKILIRGNHDKNHSNNWFINAGYSLVCEKIQISRVILSHVPAILNEKEIELGIINIHGHFHNVKRRRWEELYKKRLTDNHYLLALEYTDYKPILLEKAKRGKFVKKTKLIEY